MVNPPSYGSALAQSLKRPPDICDKLPSRPLSSSFSPAAIPISPPRNPRRSSRRLSFGGPWTPSSPTLGPSVSLPPSPSTSFVGSYENSLLSGRMSTPLSNPLEFVCEIGVIASRSSSSGPRCPPHASLPFEAAFYRTGDGADTASPYVGTVDLESYYHAAAKAALRPPPRLSSPPIGDNDADADDIMHDVIEYNNVTTPQNTNKYHNNSSKLLHSFPGYRIPPKGQVQLIIRNSTNPTPLKIYLVPYDLEDMPPSTKTFLRQKSYSVVPPSSTENKSFGRESLRYAVHLQFCSPHVRPNKQRKYYLHKTIRLVFSNRRMDPDEKLRVVNESLEGIVDDSSSALLSSSHGSSTSSSSITSRSSEKAFVPYAGPGEQWTSLIKNAKSSSTSNADRRKSFDPAFMRRGSGSSSLRSLGLGVPPTSNTENNSDTYDSSTTTTTISNNFSNNNYNQNRHHRRLSDSWALIDNLQTDIDEEDHLDYPCSPDYPTAVASAPLPSSFDSLPPPFLPPSRLSLNSIPDSDSEDVFFVDESSPTLGPPLQIPFDTHLDHSFLYSSPNTPLQPSPQLDLDPSSPSSQLTRPFSRSISRSGTPTPRDYIRDRPIR